MGIVYGLLSAFAWGTGDFLITLLTRRVGTVRALVAIQAASLGCWGILFAIRPATSGGDPGLWMLALAMGVCHVIGLVLVYRAFEVGTVSLVSPISSSFGVVTALLALATGERPPAPALAGALLLFVGVVFATRSGSGHNTSKVSMAGVPEALGSALGFGTMFWIFYFFVQPRLGYVGPLVLVKILATGAALVALHRAPERPKSQPSKRSTLLILAMGAALMDTLAWLAYIMGSATSFATIVTALASLFSVFTILLARVFLRERLAPHQWVGVAVILLGVLLVGV